MVQGKVVILVEGDESKKDYPELGRSYFPQRIEQRSSSPTLSTIGNFKKQGRKPSFPEGVDHNLPREVVAASSLEVLKARLDEILGNLVELKMTLLRKQSTTKWPLKVHSNPNCSVILG